MNHLYLCVYQLLLFFLFLNNKLDNLTKEIQLVKTDLTKEIQLVRTDLTKEIQLVRTDLTKEINSVKIEVLWIKFRLDPNEHPKWNQSENKEIE